MPDLSGAAEKVNLEKLWFETNKLGTRMLSITPLSSGPSSLYTPDIKDSAHCVLNGNIPVSFRENLELNHFCGSEMGNS